GAGIIGILIALAIAAASTLRPHAPVEIVEPLDWSAEADDEAAPADEAADADAAELSTTR
ncbi:MAG: dinucleotide-utilizing enzyme, partial [Microbacterium sp.]